jgi:hypothetical protein
MGSTSSVIKRKLTLLADESCMSRVPMKIVVYPTTRQESQVCGADGRHHDIQLLDAETSSFRSLPPASLLHEAGRNRRSNQGNTPGIGKCHLTVNSESFPWYG